MARSNTDKRKKGVLLEDIDAKLEQVVEGVGALDTRMAGNQKEFHFFQKEVEYKFDTVLDELRVIRNELKEKVSREEFALLEKKVLKLEKEIRTR